MPKQSQQKQPNMNIRIDDLLVVEPMTQAQEQVFEAWKSYGNNLALTGTAGTGKTYIAMYLALEQVLDKGTSFDKLIIMRSVVPTREVGYLPGSLEEKLNAYTGPYRAIANELFDNIPNAYDRLVHNNYVQFESTSFIRGETYDNAIILVDEMQNLNFHELESVITRVGFDTAVIFSGDYHQSDLVRRDEKEGIHKFLHILDNMTSFSCIEFSWEDIVRSDLVRDYILTKEFLKAEENETKS